MYCSIRTLHQHFCDTGGAAKIAVDLEGGMSIKKIIISTAATFISTCGCKLILDEFVCMIAIQHFCPPIYLPSHTPACRYIAALHECILCGTVQFWGTVRRDLIRREQSIEMGYMTMMIVRIVNIIQPFLQLAVLA